MDVRTWTADAIEEGGTPKWAVGMIVKLTAEAILAGFLAYCLMRFLVWWIDVQVLRDYLMTSTDEAVLLPLLPAAFKVVHCKFTEPLFGG